MRRNPIGEHNGTYKTESMTLILYVLLLLPSNQIIGLYWIKEKMSELIKLTFECIVRCNIEYADELGRDIASDLLNEMDNGVDYIDWRFKDSQLYDR